MHVHVNGMISNQPTNKPRYLGARGTLSSNNQATHCVAGGVVVLDARLGNFSIMHTILDPDADSVLGTVCLSVCRSDCLFVFP